MNYKLIGSDQKEYGPVSLEQLRQWVGEGRVNAQTLIQPEGETGWKPLGFFPELTAVAGSAGPAPLGPPAVPPGWSQPGVDPAQAVRTPATLLMIVGGLGILGGLLGLALNLFNVGMMNMHNLPPNLPPQFGRWMEFWSGPWPSIAALLMNVVIVLGGLSMLKLQRWDLALGACIVAILASCLSCCCFLGLAAGIWGLVVLVKPEIKAAFH
jgi:hypothetical protein